MERYFYLITLITITFISVTSFRTTQFNNRIIYQHVPYMCASNNNYEELSTEIINKLGLWLRKQSLEDFYSNQKARTIIQDALTENTVMSYEPLYDKYWKYLEDYMIEESRSINDLIGSETMNKFLKTVESTDIYEPTTVRAFLQTPIFENMIGGILYEGIFEFFQRIDLVGNVVNQLPLIGPIRQTFIREFKKVMDITVGNQLKTFLASYNRVAIQRIINFILSTDNRMYLAKANRNVIESIINRPLNSLLPPPDMRNNIKQSIWQSILSISINQEWISIIDTFYDRFGDKKLDEIVDTIDKLPVVKKTVIHEMNNFLNSNEGQDIIKLIKSS